MPVLIPLDQSTPKTLPLKGGEMAGVDSGRIGVEVHQAKGLEQLLQLDKDRIREQDHRRAKQR